MNMLMLAAAALPMFTQDVATEWPSEEAARAASAAVVELDEGERYLWTSRWDDRNVNHAPLSKALNSVGMPTTCYINGSSQAQFTKILREVVAGGNSIGVHTISHDYMDRLLPMKCFREVMQCRVELELDSQSPVVTFGAPYGHGAIGRNLKICGEAMRNAGLLGGSEGNGNSCVAFGLAPDEWVGAFTFRANDKSPDRALFDSGFNEGLKRIDSGKTDLTGPVLTLGVHPWQDEKGRADLAAMVKDALARTPGIKTMTMNGYVARRLQFLNSKVEKGRVEGRKAVFRLTRPRVCELGAKEPVLLRLSDGRIVKVAAPPAEDVPSRFIEVKDALSVSDDGTEFTYEYRNATGATQPQVEFLLRLPAGYTPGVARRTLANVRPGAAERLVFRVRRPTDPVVGEGTLFAAMEVNFPGTRIWTTLVRQGAKVARPCPRDTAIACGPFPKSVLPDDGALSAMAMPGAALAGVADEQWFRCDGSADGDAVWAMTAFRKDGRIAAVKKIGGYRPPPGKESAYLLCLEFDVDTAAHGDRWKLSFGGGHITAKNVKAFLNGKDIKYPRGEFAFRNGRNRLLLAIVDLDPNMFYTTCEAVSVKDGALAPTVPLAAAPLAVGALPFEVGFTISMGRLTDKKASLVVKASEMASFAAAERDGAHVLTWKGHPACGADFTVTARMRPEGPDAWSYDFSYAGNASGLDVEEIGFPEITVPRTDATKLLYPRQTGVVRAPKWSAYKPGAMVARAGPLVVGFHFIAALDDSGSWYMDQRGDARWRALRYDFRQGTKPGTLVMTAYYVPEVVAGLRQAGTLPFPGTVRRFTGGWYEAAAIYRDWASTQDWFKKAKARNFGKLRDIALWMWNRGRSGEVAPQVEKFMADTGLPAALDWYWWHEIPYDTSYPFFWPPREPEADFRATVKRLRDKGAYVQTYTNGMLWDRLDRRWSAEGENENLVRRDGSPVKQVFNPYTGADTGWMCGNAPTFHSHLRKVEKTLAGCGLNGVYMDMIANCGYGTCWSDRHGHAPGGGKAVAEGYAKFVAQVRADNPGLQLSSEEEGEAFLELFDSLIVLYGGFERLGVGVGPEFDMPPIFQAIFHGTVAMFGSYAVIDGITPWDEKWGVRPAIDEAKWAGRFPDQFACELARGVAWGVQPCVHKVTMEQMTAPKWAEDWRFTVDTARFYHANREFLFDGEMAAPGRMKCATQAVDFFRRGCYTKEKDFKTCRQPALPTVFHTVWRSPAGRVAAVLVNWTRHPQKYSLSAPDISGNGEIPPLSWRLLTR
ncbi:MAG: polysaccharide deacetylase family protein [Kiritimatiellae bacterium]|nr:polysaccharide deacetylase family protein [Kiritimatiellia bacterium]